MTPMVDVVMVILVFFMASASVLGPEWLLRTALPPSKPAPVVPPSDLLRVELLLMRRGEAVVITTRGAAGVTTDLNDATMERLTEWMVELVRTRGAGSIAVVVRPSPEVAYEDVVRAHEIPMSMGIDKIGILDPR